MIVDFEETPLFTALKGPVEGLGFQIVEVSSRVRNSRAQVQLVIFRESGVDHQACTEVGRSVTSTLEDFFQTRDIWLEVSSPGLERIIKTWREFRLFSGLPGKVLRRGGAWENLTLGAGLVGNDTVKDIIKAKLDRLGEVKQND